MPNPSAADLEPEVVQGFHKVGEQPPKRPAVLTIAQVVAGRLTFSLGAWPASTGFVKGQTIAFFVDAFLEQSPPADASRLTTLVAQVLPNQFLGRGKAPPEAEVRRALVRLTVGALLQKSLPQPKAAPLPAASVMTELYLAGA